MRFQVHNQSALNCTSSLVLANHPSILDVVYLISLTPNATCVVRSGLFNNIFTAGPIRLAGYISNEDPNILEKCLAALEAGDNLVLFPEGTRSVPGKALAFQRGASYLALEAKQYPILPVVIDCNPPTLIKGQPWYVVPEKRVEWRLWVDEPLTHDNAYDSSLPRSRQVRQLTRFLSEYFTARLADERAQLLGQDAAKGVANSTVTDTQ